MTKNERLELQVLSLKVYGSKNGYLKLIRKGTKMTSGDGFVRYVPVSPDMMRKAMQDILFERSVNEVLKEHSETFQKLANDEKKDIE